jgi:hypothetical protein
LLPLAPKKLKMPKEMLSKEIFSCFSFVLSSELYSRDFSLIVFDKARKTKKNCFSYTISHLPVGLLKLKGKFSARREEEEKKN